MELCNCTCKVCRKKFRAKRETRFCSGECKKLLRTNKYIGQKFGKVVIVDAYRQENEYGRHRTYVLCKCKCGNVVEIRYDSLTTGNTRSCGCEGATTQFKSNDLTGKVNAYGCIVSEDIGSPTKNPRIRRCKCHCGKEYIIEGTYLIKSNLMVALKSQLGLFA